MNEDNIAIFDIESVGAVHQFSSICEIGGVLVDKDLNEIDRFNLRCRLPEGEIPSAAACVVNKSNVNLLTKSNLSEYLMKKFINIFGNFTVLKTYTIGSAVPIKRAIFLFFTKLSE